MPEAASAEERAQLVAALSVGEAVIYLRRAHERLVAGVALDRALVSLAAPGAAAARMWLARFAASQRRDEAGPAKGALRARAAAMVIGDALARHAAFFDAAGFSIHGGGRPAVAGGAR